MAQASERLLLFKNFACAACYKAIRPVKGHFVQALDSAVFRVLYKL